MIHSVYLGRHAYKLSLRHARFVIFTLLLAYQPPATFPGSR